ncbi:MAG: CpsD/CapB family tyrosine-protein kinase [Chloroflexota bacterium]
MTGNSDSSRNGAGLVTVQAPRSAAAEAYRSLSTNIQFSSLDQDVKTLLVTSVSPNEGKSIVLANLAITMAEGGREIVVVDCDLRQPSLHTLFGLTDQPGLTSMVLDETLAPPLQQTSVEHVSLVAAGPPPPNPAELVASTRFSRVLSAISAKAEMVLLDAPPVTAVADAAILATRVDGVLLVVDSGRTRRDAAKRAREQLERVGARLLGVVLTNVKPEKGQNTYLSASR